MNTDDTIARALRHLRAVWRAETLIGELKLRALLKQGGLIAVAGVIGVMGLGMLNGAAYFAFAPDIGDAAAMGVVALADFIIAVGLVLLANKKRADPQMEIALHLRDQAMDAIELEARIATDEVRDFVRKPVQFAGSAAAALIGLITAILRARRRD